MNKRTNEQKSREYRREDVKDDDDRDDDDIDALVWMINTKIKHTIRVRNLS